MGQFAYKAKDASGRNVEGEVSARNATEARMVLIKQKLVPISLAEKSGGRSSGPSAKPAANNLKKIPSKEVRVMTRQLATLIKSGIPIVQSLELLRNSIEDANLKEILFSISDQVRQGKRFSETIGKYPNAFDRLYVNMVKAGEEGGVMDTVLYRLADYMERSEALRKKIVGALRYPMIVMGVAALVIGAILVFVIPKFKELFSANGKELPALTQAVVNISDYLIAHAVPVFGGIGVGVFLLMRHLSTPEGREQVEKIVIGMPLIGPVMLKGALSRFTRTLGSLLSAGVPILDALDIAANTVENRPVEEMVRRVRDTVTNGKMITQALENEPLAGNLLVQMVTVGEQSGQLDIMLERVAAIYEDDVETSSENLVGLLEPIMIVVVGGIVATLVLAMYLPMFQMSGNVG